METRDRGCPSKTGILITTVEVIMNMILSDFFFFYSSVININKSNTHTHTHTGQDEAFTNTYTKCGVVCVIIMRALESSP